MTRRLPIIAIAALVLGLASPAVAAVRQPAELLPDGETRPVIESAELLAPQRHNHLLEADLAIAADTDLGIRRYEYRWNGSTPTSTSVVNPTVSFAPTLPGTHATLEVRAVDRHGRESAWATAWEGVTPAVPNVIVAGDSVASGYSRQWFTQDSVCRDDSYSYGATVQRVVAASLPAAWAPKYVNIAFPGAGVGDVLDGGSDSCSAGHPSQVDDIERLADPSTWNMVVMTAGINSTNWVDVITDVTRGTLFSLTDSGDKKVCQRAVTEDWNLAQRRAAITDTTAAIVGDIEGRTNARIYWTSYYQLAGTRFAPLWSPVGGECEDEMNLALSELHEAIRAGLDDQVTWIDLGGERISVQKWAGWPHPNPEGHVAIGTTIAAAITG